MWFGCQRLLLNVSAINAVARFFYLKKKKRERGEWEKKEKESNVSYVNKCRYLEIWVLAGNVRRKFFKNF